MLQQRRPHILIHLILAEQQLEQMESLQKQEKIKIMKHH